jgi:hypothetical protein
VIYKNMFLDLYSECAEWLRSILFCILFLFSGFFWASTHLPVPRPFA